MADRTESVVLDFEVDMEDSIESIESLTKANKALREERKKLNLDTEEGKKRINEINAALDRNNTKIKDNSSAIEKQRANIGNYKSALDGVHPALGKVGEGLESGTQGFKAMTLQALRFIATPIGAVLAALVTVFTLLKTALSQNDALMDKFENVTNAVGVVLEVVVARVGKLGEALIALASGNFSEAINKTAEAFGGLGDEIENAVRQQQLFLDASRELEDSQRNLRLEQAKSVNQIKLLDQVAKNSNKTFEEREQALKTSLDLQKDLIDSSEDLARRDLLITARRLRVSKEFQQQSNETFDQYIDRLLNTSALSGEELDKLVDKAVALENARNASLDLQQKTENDLAKIQNERNKVLEEQLALLRATERAENEIKRSRKDGVERQDRQDPLTDAFATQLDNEFDIRQRFNDRVEDAQKEADLERRRREKREADARIELERQVADAKLNITLGFLDVAASLFDQQSKEYKIIASFQTLISTYSAAQKAFESFAAIPVVGPGLGAAAAALAVAQGLARVAQINGVQFAEGGWTGPGEKYKPVGVVHADEYVTPKWLVNSPKAQPHLNALENMRQRGYADGGLVVNTATQPINQSFDVMNLIKRMPAPVVSVKEINTEQRRVRVKENISKR